MKLVCGHIVIGNKFVSPAACCTLHRRYISVIYYGLMSLFVIDVTDVWN